MKILLLNDYSELIGGVEVYIKALCFRLKSEGLEVREFYVEDYVNELPRNFLEALYYKYAPQKQLATALEKALDEFEPDLIHIHNNQLYPYTILLTLRKRGVVVIQSIHDLYQFNIDYHYKKSISSFLKRIFYQHLRKRQIKIIKHFIVHSQFIKRQLQEFLPSSAISHIPLMVETTEKSGNKTYFAREKIILYSGRIELEKGIYFLLKGFISADFLKDYDLVIAGKGSKAKSVKKLAEEEERIHYIGYVEDIDSWYKKAAILVVPSIWEEPFGLVGLEGFSHGIAVIASRIGGIPEWCIHGETGLLFTPNDIVDFHKKLKQCISDIAGTEKRIRNAYQLLASNHGSSLHMKRLHSLYIRLLKEERVGEAYSD